MPDVRLSEVIAAYGELVDGDLDERDLVDRLSELTVEVLNRHGIGARRSRPGVVTSAATIAVPLPSMSVSLEICGARAPLTGGQIAAVGARASTTPLVAVLSLRGFAAEAIEGGDNVLLMDRQHLEAILSGLVDPAGLFEEAVHLATFDAEPYLPLTRFLLHRNPAPAPRFMPPDRVPPPWDLLQDTAAEVRVRQVLGGLPGWPEITGMTAVDADRLLLTSADGLIEVHVRRGTTDWFLPMPGLRGAPVRRADGSVLVLCGDAVIAYRGGTVEPIAGGFRAAVGLAADRDGEAWVLSGTGATFGGGSGTLSLTRVGERFGSQQTYGVAFAAGVHGLAWLRGRRFFLATGSDSGIVDLSRSSAVSPRDHVRSEQPYPEHVIALDARTVLTGSGDGRGVGVTICRTDLVTHSVEVLARLRLNKIQGMAEAAEGPVYLLGDVRGNDHSRPRPVILKATIPRPAPAAAEDGPTSFRDLRLAAMGDRRSEDGPTSFRDLRLAAMGDRRSYALDATPIADGGQATVFGARHRASGTRVAFKRLNRRSVDDIARMRREIEAGQRYGDNAHVVPVLDFDPGASWLVMPLASGTAEEVLDELEDPRRLLDLVAAVCAGLRRPHQDGWVHRDLKPTNILRLDGEWAVADWGLGRRPRGQTSQPGRTRAGFLYGTEGFAAPELSDDAHEAGPQADIFSIGQLIGWAVTRQWPRANRPLIPAGTVWQTAVEVMTHDDPARRPASVDDVLELVRSAPAEPTGQG
ncbi:protein kinase [Actinoplanes oblitus]|uniref:Protein kinase n=1 Tax=Actinoplanes oblitus TaxID=3040509 RepID=A0ABY8WUA7_9ACTN|nr:protein kinase [Actinoplanes oblitus]WIN00438.1 protein kinase [Actinoplanes oblitus]